MMVEAAEVALRTATYFVPWVMAAGAVVTLLRVRTVQLVVYGCVVVVLVARWLARSYEGTGLVGARALAQALLIPLLATVLVVASLRLATVFPAIRRSILGGTLVALGIAWILFKFPNVRGSVAAASQGRLLRVEDVAVLGLSYTVLKLAHVLVDAMRTRPPPVRASTLLGMVAFPPTWTQGPMHRYEEFAASFDDLPPFRSRNWDVVVRRVTWGTFKSTVAAPFAASLALGPLADPGAYGAAALWGATYAYAAMIYLDFSGLSDIAIGFGAAFGVEVPENFNSPYWKQDIQRFWQAWHMTLTRWLQAYVFMPVSRSLMRTRLRAQPRVIMAVAWMVTFGLCGVWHGESPNFLAWGFWHGAGIFAYTAVPARLRAPTMESSRWTFRGIAWWIVTIQFVCIGWVLFACPLPAAGRALARMFLLEH